MNPHTLSWAAGAVAAAMLVACASPNEPLLVSQGTVIQNVTVVNTRDGSLQARMTLVIDQGKILKIIATGPVRTTGSAVLIDAAGQFVVPGYLDMHTHAMPVANQSPNHWPMLIANGITGIREMAGSAELIQLARQLNTASEAGRIAAPEILQMPGDLIAGNPPVAAVVAQVQKQKAEGASFIKVVTANREATLALLAEATRQGLGVAGHLPIAISAVDAAMAGWRAVEHLGSGMGILLDCAGEEAAIRGAMLRGAGAKPPFPPTFVISPTLYRAVEAPLYQRILDSYDDAKCRAATQVLAQQQTWQVPTLLRIKTIATSSDAAYRNDPNLAYIDKTTRALWENLAQQYATNVPAAAASSFRQYYGAQQKLLKLMQQQGVKLLAGSDLGGIWIIPGVSLHQEFAELAAAGLSPLQVLQTTTLNGAEFLQRLATMGTVDEGKNADLVLLAANPISDVANLGQITGVVLKGRYFSKDALEAMKREVALAYQAQPLKSLSAVLDPTHVH